MEYIDILEFLLAGLIGGILSGMLGVGGGIIFVPVVQQVLINHHIREDFVAYTLANSLAIVFVVGISGTIKQIKLKNTHLSSALVTGFSAVLTSLTITYFINTYHLGNPRIFNLIFAFILILTVLRMLISKKTTAAENSILVVPALKKFIPAGLFAGLVTALSGLGGGIVMVPYFNKILKLPIKFSTGLSLSVIPVIAFPLLLFYGFKQPLEQVYPNYQTGHLIWPVVIPVVIVAIFSARLGVIISQKLSANTLKWIFVVFACITLIKVLILQ